MSVRFGRLLPFALFYPMKMLKQSIVAPAFLLACAFTAIPGNDSQSGLDLAAMNKKVSPGQDFYEYANGTWVRNTPVPAAEVAWGSPNILNDENNKKIKILVEEVASDNAAAKGSTRQQLRDYYLTAMDTVQLDKQDYLPLKPYLEKVEKINSKQELIITSAKLQRSGMRSMYRMYVTRDLKNSSRNVIYIAQSGLSLPDRDYYLKSDDRFVKIRSAYVTHIGKMLDMIGRKNAAADAKVILNLETEMARASMSRVDQRDESKTYNLYSLNRLKVAAPAISWGDYFAALNCPANGAIVVNQPDYLVRLSALVDSVPLEDWKTYLTWKLLNSSADNLSSRFENEDFAFYGKILSGQQEMKPRWRRSINAVNGTLGEIVGELYVKKYFSPQAKQRIDDMVKNIISVYHTRINSLDWMSPETKEKALAKLATLRTKLAYPDKWEDYSKIDVDRDSYLANSVRASEYFYDDMLADLGRPVDREKWGMPPQTVNAYYDPTLNEIVFPAAIMQPPFFFPEADDAVNYGAIGSVIGHEITHGFDDQGSKYDGQGNLNDWWSDADRKAFDERAKMLVDQYGKFEALPGVKVNGELTLGENIADLGGVNVSYQAYQLSMKNKKKEVIDGMTAEQRFFVAFAQLYKGNIKPEALQQRIVTDPHSPGPFRVVGVVSNLPEFYQAFDVKAGDKMHRPDNDRARIW